MNHPNPNAWWRHRRRMAYASMGGLFGIMLAAVVVEISEPQSTVLQMVAFSFAGIVGAYVGFAAWDDIHFRRDQQAKKTEFIPPQEK